MSLFLRLPSSLLPRELLGSILSFLQKEAPVGSMLRKRTWVLWASTMSWDWPCALHWWTFWIVTFVPCDADNIFLVFLWKHRLPGPGTRALSPWYEIKGPAVNPDLVAWWSLPPFCRKSYDNLTQDSSCRCCSKRKTWPSGAASSPPHSPIEILTPRISEYDNI